MPRLTSWPAGWSVPVEPLPHPALGAYAARLAGRPSFRDTVPRPQSITSRVV